MAIIPLMQTVVVTRPAELDGWGQVVPGAVITLKARVTEETNVVTTQTGEEAVASLRILLDKMAGISYDDTIKYENEIGVTVERKPLSIAPMRMFSGRSILTEVLV